MAFRGWPAEAIEFFEGLEADNSKTYWQEHKKDYEELVRGPMEELLAELAAEGFGEGKIFRPYRDVRFSKDKTPYKTNIAANNDSVYISLSAQGFGVGSGYYMMAADQLKRFREAVDDNRTGAELVKLVAAARKKDLEVGTHEELKTAPKGYPKEHARIEFLRFKDITAWRQWEVGAWLGTKAPKQRALAFFKDSRPLIAWLDANVGPTTDPNAWGRR